MSCQETETRRKGDRTTVRRATDDDAERLVVWHDDPEVARFWDWETFTIPQIQE